MTESEENEMAITIVKLCIEIEKISSQVRSGKSEARVGMLMILGLVEEMTMYLEEL